MSLSIATYSCVIVGGGNRTFSDNIPSTSEVSEMKVDLLGSIVFGIVIMIGLTVIVTGIILAVVLIKALIRYIRSAKVRKEKAVIKKSLGEVLRQKREENKMTQEFVAETIGVSRQAVSKWENGTSDPSTSNLIALARLYGISTEELLNEVK